MSTGSTTFRKVSCKKLGINFREVTEIVNTPLIPPGDKQVLVKLLYAGINASDINFTNGLYFNTTPKMPFDCGFEGVGIVSQVGHKVTDNFKPGDAVFVMKYGCFAEYIYADITSAWKIPSADPAFMALMTSGLTASIALEEVGRLKPKEVVLVTAAAGGTGQFAVQLSKLAGCHVIGTCGSESKMQFLKSIGCDRVINYKKEDIHSVLQKEYPKGVNVIYESVGGHTFDIALENLAIGGRLIVIGAISQYKDQSAFDNSKESSSNSKLGLVSKVPLPQVLLKKSASVCGFFLLHYTKVMPAHNAKLFQLYLQGKIKSGIDPKNWSGLDSIPEAIDWLYDGKNSGKIVVQITAQSKL